MKMKYETQTTLNELTIGGGEHLFYWNWNLLTYL